MAQILAYPFRLAAGRVATVEQTSDEANAQQLAVTVLTRRGERPLVPDFGVVDPTFDDLSPAELQMQVELFGPPVELVNVFSEPDLRTGTRLAVTVAFE